MKVHNQDIEELRQRAAKLHAALDQFLSPTFPGSERQPQRDQHSQSGWRERLRSLLTALVERGWEWLRDVLGTARKHPIAYASVLTAGIPIGYATTYVYQYEISMPAGVTSAIQALGTRIGELGEGRSQLVELQQNAINAINNLDGKVSAKLAQLSDAARPTIEEIDRIDKNLSKLVAVQPGSDEQVIVMFENGSHTLDADQAKKYGEAIKRLLVGGMNSNSELMIIGYGDSTWHSENNPEMRFLENLRLAAKRANHVRRMIEKLDPHLPRDRVLTLAGGENYGETMIPDQTAEPIDRRATVALRYRTLMP